jgi:hypothetical protein
LLLHPDRGRATCRRLLVVALLLAAGVAGAQPPEEKIVCYARVPSIGSPTWELLACGWHQWDVRGERIVPVPPAWINCRGAVILPLSKPRREPCRMTAWLYPRCPVLCPEELEPELVFVDGFESGDTSAWSASRSPENRGRRR